MQRLRPAVPSATYTKNVGRGDYRKSSFEKTPWALARDPGTLLCYTRRFESRICRMNTSN